MANNSIIFPNKPYITLIGENTKINGTSLYDVQPKLLLSFAAADEFEKVIRLRFGNEIQTYSLGALDNVLEHGITQSQAVSLLQKYPGKNVTIILEITYTKIITGEQKQEIIKFQIGVGDSLLSEEAKSIRFNLRYEPIYSNKDQMEIQLNELLDNNINSAYLTIEGVPSSISSITVDFNRESVVYKSPFDRIERRFGPYKELKINTEPKDKIKVIIENKRGLRLTKEISINYRRYFNPIISATKIERVGGFGTSMRIKNLKVQHFEFRKDASFRNELISFNMNYYSNTESSMREQVVNLFGIKNDSPPSDFIVDHHFKQNESYRIQFTANDLVESDSGVGSSSVFSLTTGRPIMYMDSARAEVGIGTTDPLGSFHVEGTSYARASFALNSIHYKPGIPEDSDDYNDNPPWVMTSPESLGGIFDGPIEWGTLENINWADLEDKFWRDLNK